MPALTIGVLALQGGFSKHVESLKKIGIDVLLVRRPQDLEKCHGLIIPGGESTCMLHHMEFIGMFPTLQSFAENKPIFGTCAGLILLAEEVIGSSQKSLGVLQVTVERNAFGRQIESFAADVSLAFEDQKETSIRAIFIRAPRIRRCSPAVKILAAYEGEPILVQQGIHLGAVFHPELTQDLTIHKHFVKLVEAIRKA